MSARPKIKSSVFIGLGIVVLLVLTVMLIGLRNVEGEEKLKQYWNVGSIMIDGKEEVHNYRLKSLSFLDDGKVLMPRHTDYMGSPPIKFSKWELLRDGFMDCQVKIFDLKQSIFDELYDIEVLDHRDPQILKLSSDRIEIYMRALKNFSTGSSMIGREPFIVPEEMKK